MNKVFCIDCEVLIKIPSGFVGFMDKAAGTEKDQPVEYKSGWKCAKCAKKK